MRVLLRILGFILLLGVLAVGCWFYGMVIPVRLDIVSVPSVVHYGEDIDENEIKVDLVSFFGNRRAVTGFDVEHRGNGISVFYNGFKTVADVNVLLPENYRVDYWGTVYAGKPLDKDKVHVYAQYSDGVEREVNVTSLPSDIVPFGENLEMTVVTDVGETVWKPDVSLPVRIEAYYNSDVQVGDPFDSDFISVVLFYEDNSELQVTEFEVVDPPEYLREDTTVRISSSYGVVDLTLKPANQQRLQAVYNGRVYVGDLLDPSKVTLTMIGSDGQTHEVDECWFDDIGYIKANTRVGVHSNYGDGEVYVECIPVVECTADISGELIEGAPINVQSIHLRYADDTVRSVTMDEVQFSNMGTTYRSGDFDAWFDYHGVHYSFPLLVIPDSVTNLRDMDPNVQGITYTTYSLTEAQIDTIAILCQRVAGEDIMLAAAEASLIANRYELYSNDPVGDGTYLVKYMKECGYWGDDVNGYLVGHHADQTVGFVVRDALINGHRIFPSYVDDRANAGSLINITTSTFVPFETELTKSDGSIYWFYSFVSSDLRIAYGYSDYAYQQVQGVQPPMEHAYVESSVMDLYDSGIVFD